VTEWKDAGTAVALDKDTVHVWMFHMNTTPPGIKRFYPVLSDDEKQRSERFIHFMHRKRFIASQGFMRNVLSHYLDIEPQDIRYAKKHNGKPVLDAKVHHADLHFNLSHSSHFAMLAVSRNLEVGMDVEYMDRKNQWQKLIKRFFTEPEQQAIFALPQEQQQRAFFQVWTRKEAHMKVTGQGLHLAPTQFTVSVPPQSPQLLAVNNLEETELSRWHMYDISLPESARTYCACLSVEGVAREIEQFIFS
jgi:4'-phosphopantetheinyl transferase